MKNGVENRKNGTRIVKRASTGNPNFFMYDVYAGDLKISGPWDYLDNARRDADAYKEANQPSEEKPNA